MEKQKDLDCHICGKTYKNKITLSDHIGCHDENEVMNFYCEICDTIFFSKCNLRFHIARSKKHAQKQQSIKKNAKPARKLQAVANIKKVAKAAKKLRAVADNKKDVKGAKNHRAVADIKKVTKAAKNLRAVADTKKDAKVAQEEQAVADIEMDGATALLLEIERAVGVCANAGTAGVVDTIEVVGIFDDVEMDVIPPGSPSNESAVVASDIYTDAEHVSSVDLKILENLQVISPNQSTEIAEKLAGISDQSIVPQAGSRDFIKPDVKILENVQVIPPNQSTEIAEKLAEISDEHIGPQAWSRDFIKSEVLQRILKETNETLEKQISKRVIEIGKIFTLALDKINFNELGIFIQVATIRSIIKPDLKYCFRLNSFVIDEPDETANCIFEIIERIKSLSLNVTAIICDDSCNHLKFFQNRCFEGCVISNTGIPWILDYQQAKKYITMNEQSSNGQAILKAELEDFKKTTNEYVINYDCKTSFDLWLLKSLMTINELIGKFFNLFPEQQSIELCLLSTISVKELQKNFPRQFDEMGFLDMLKSTPQRLAASPVEEQCKGILNAS